MSELSFEERLIDLIKDLTEDQQKKLLDHIESQQAEFRKHPRKDCAIGSAYFIQDKIYTDLIKNISAGGVYITAKKSHSVGDEISINFMLSGQKRPLRLFGKIVRSDPNGFAVTFYEEFEELLNKFENESA